MKARCQCQARPLPQMTLTQPNLSFHALDLIFREEGTEGTGPGGRSSITQQLRVDPSCEPGCHGWGGYTPSQFRQRSKAIARTTAQRSINAFISRTISGDGPPEEQYTVRKAGGQRQRNLQPYQVLEGGRMGGLRLFGREQGGRGGGSTLILFPQVFPASSLSLLSS